MCVCRGGGGGGGTENCTASGGYYQFIFRQIIVDKHIIDSKFDLTQLSSDDDQCTTEPFNIYMAKSQSTEA